MNYFKNLIFKYTTFKDMKESHKLYLYFKLPSLNWLLT